MGVTMPRKRSLQNETKAAPKTVGAAKLTIEILRTLAKQPGPVGVTPLASTLGRYPGTVYAVLKTLQAEGVVEFNADTKTYRLSLGGVLEISNLQTADDVPERLRAQLREASERFGVCIYLSQRVRADSMIIVDCAAPNQPLGLYAKVGFRIPVPLGGAGRLLVGWEGTGDAHLRDAYKRTHWLRHKPPYKQWAQQARQDRMAGFAYEEDSVPEGLATIAVPVIEAPTNTEAAPIRYMLNAIGARGDFAGENLPVLVDAVKHLARLPNA